MSPIGGLGAGSVLQALVPPLQIGELHNLSRIIIQIISILLHKQPLLLPGRSMIDGKRLYLFLSGVSES